MVLEPGKLTNLGNASSQGRQAWTQYVTQSLRGAKTASGSINFLETADASITDAIIIVDWPAYPVRTEVCLASQERAYRLMDWTTPQGDRGRSFAHEEYLEWRTVRNPAGKVIRIEMTTEFQEYWDILAQYRPMTLLRLVARFAGEATVNPRDIYGTLDPFAAGVTPGARGEAFRRMMLPASGEAIPRSPYNNGQKAICFMYQSVNTLSAAVQLAAFAAKPLVKTVDGQEIPLTGREAINNTQQAAADCRNSDPLIVESVIGLSCQRKKVVFNDPIGVYITSIDENRLLLPDGVTPAPMDWFALERGTRGNDPDGDPDRLQRLVLQVPPNPQGIVLGDLIDANTGKNIEFGAQIADFLQVGLFVQASDENQVNQSTIPVTIQQEPIPCDRTPDCALFTSQFEEFEQSQMTLQPLEIGHSSRIRGQ